jgi:hypothetical protein
VKVSRGSDGGQGGGSYALTLIQAPIAAGKTIGSSMTLGSSHSGSISRGSVDVMTFNGTAGHTATFTIGRISNNGFSPDVYVFSPTGGLSEFGCGESCSQDVSLTADGVYLVLVTGSDNKDITSTYTLSVK